LPVAQIELTENQSGFLHAGGRDRRVDDIATRCAYNVQAQVGASGELCPVLVDGCGQRNLLDSGVKRLCVELEHGPPRIVLRKTQRPARYILLAVKAHVMVTADFASAAQLECRHINVGTCDRTVIDRDRQLAIGSGSIAPRYQDSHYAISR
jgi:hypothetical protein